MTARPPSGPFLVNVAGLLADEVGSERLLRIDDASIALPDDLTLALPISGRVRLVHENRGILADVSLGTALAGECSRCLRPLVTPLEIRFREEYLPTLDLTTGRRLPTDEEPEALRLTEHHELDLEPSIRDAILLGEPIAPLDRPDCPGLCIVCGLPMDEGIHDHPTDDVDPRLEALRAFLPRTDDRADRTADD